MIAKFDMSFVKIVYFTLHVLLAIMMSACASNTCHNYAINKEYDAAIQACTHAVEVNPRSGRAYYDRGKSYAEKKQYHQAILDFTKAIELRPKDYIVYFARGVAYRRHP